MSLTNKEKVVAAAMQLGFSRVGFAKAEAIALLERSHLEEWLAAGRAGEMGYMANHLDKRCDPTLLVDGCQTVVVLAMNYYPEVKQAAEVPQFAYYAYGADYHEVIRGRLQELLHQINQEVAPCEGRGFTDSAPVMERYWAERAGVGFIGKNNLLIVPGAGSFFFLAVLLIDIELEPDRPMARRCGECRRCLEACPTQALIAPYQMDARRCLSYLTIEYRGALPLEQTALLSNRLYGCDICQLVCPWNRFAVPHQVDEFRPSADFLSLDRDRLAVMTPEEFRRIFKGSAVKRTKYEGLMRNFSALCDCEDGE